MASNNLSKRCDAAVASCGLPPALEIQLHQQFCKRSVFTQKPWEEVARASDYVLTHTKTKLRWCDLCQHDDGPDLLCFHEDHMAPEHQDIFRDILDQSLNFHWNQDGCNSFHRIVFSICTYFLFNEDHILPLFLNSLHPDYTRFYDKHNYLAFLFDMAEARYDVLASFLLSYSTDTRIRCLFPLPFSFARAH